MIKEARFYRKLQNRKVECTACARHCQIADGSHGFCFVRQNVDGRLRLVNYGSIAAVQIDPIEKKPFNHFMPGSYVFGIGTQSCNFNCMFCQNYNISKDTETGSRNMSPEDVVRLALESRVQGIAYTYNEPAIFIEYALDTARLAHEKGLFNVFVTNGYLSLESIEAMKGLIDAAVIGIKGDLDEKFANKYEAVPSTGPIRESMVALKKAGIHVEVTDLVVPRVGDSDKACDALTRWICENLGPDTPVQFIGFHPDYKMLDYPDTPYEMLKLHYDIAKKNGLRYVYIGNSPGNPYENTYCPGCGALAIGRHGIYLTEWNLDNDLRCNACGCKTYVKGHGPKTISRRGITAFY